MKKGKYLLTNNNYLTIFNIARNWEVDMKRFGSLPKVALVGIYLAFGVSLVVALHAISSSIIIIANADDMGRYQATNMYWLCGAEDDDSPVQSISGRSEFQMVNLFGEYRILRMPRFMAIFVAVELLVYAGLFFVAVVQLANLFEEICKGRPFGVNNIRRIRRLGLCLVVMALAKAFAQFGGLFILWNDVLIPGVRIPWRFFWYEMHPGLLLAGLAVLGAAEVFRTGARLQEEQDLTV
jgi:hypothetical protein